MKKTSHLFLFIFLYLIANGTHAQSSLIYPEGITTMGADTIYAPEIQRGDTVKAVYYIANFGTEKFWIYQVHAACQCTAPQYANDTFLPGRKDSVVLFFHSLHTADLVYEKSAIVLTPLGEKSYYIKGNMTMPVKGKSRKSRMIRISNQIK